MKVEGEVAKVEGRRECDGGRNISNIFKYFKNCQVFPKIFKYFQTLKNISYSPLKNGPSPLCSRSGIELW